MIRFEKITVAITVVVFAVAQMGCATIRGGGAAARPAPKPSDLICYTREENSRIEAFKVRCRSKVKELRAKARHDLATKNNQSKTKLKACQVRLNGCYEQAKAKQTCPSCVKPAVVVGAVSGMLGLAAGVVFGVVATLALKGDLR